MNYQRHIQTVTSTELVLSVPVEFINQQVKVLILPLKAANEGRSRRPLARYAGKVTETGDVFSSVSAQEWGLE
jgi:hypothetical protein